MIHNKCNINWTLTKIQYQSHECVIFLNFVFSYTFSSLIKFWIRHVVEKQIYFVKQLTLSLQLVLVKLFF